MSTEIAKLETEKSIAEIAEHEGFKVLESGAPELYWHLEPGSILVGELVGSSPIVDPKTGEVRKLLRFVTERRCLVKKKGSDETFFCEVGDVVSVGQRFKLKPLDVFLDGTTPRSIILIRATGEESIGGGQTMWKFDIAAKEKATEAVFSESGTD